MNTIPIVFGSAVFIDGLLLTSQAFGDHLNLALALIYAHRGTPKVLRPAAPMNGYLNIIDIVLADRTSH